jgi:hypothetical protein
VLSLLAAVPALADAMPSKSQLLERVKAEAEIYGEIGAIWQNCSKKPPPVEKAELIENRQFWSEAERRLIAERYDAGGRRGRLVACKGAKARAEKLIEALERLPGRPTG